MMRTLFVYAAAMLAAVSGTLMAAAYNYVGNFDTAVRFVYVALFAYLAAYAAIARGLKMTEFIVLSSGVVASVWAGLAWAFGASKLLIATVFVAMFIVALFVMSSVAISGKISQEEKQ